MTALNLKKQQNTVAVIIAVISILFLLASCGGGGGGGGGVAAPASDEESTTAGSSSTASTSSPAAPAVTETARYTVNGVTYIIMSNGTVNASNADGSARAITSSASGSTYTITDANKTLIISIGAGGTAMITVTDSDTGATQTLYATSGGTATAVTRTVSFVTNGGTAIDDIEVPDSNAAVLPNASGKSTWNFYKWYTDSSLTTQYNTSAPVTENITLYAVWARSYTIDGASYSVLSNGKVIKADGTVVGTAAEPFNSVSFTDGGKAVSITVSGSTTTATVTEGGNTRTFTDNGSGSLSPVMRTVTFDSKGGSSVTDVSVADGSGITAPASPSKQGYTFAGWCTDSGATTAYSFGTPVTGNITLYAKWTAGSVTYTVKHLQQNVSGSGYTEVTADRQTLGGTTGSQTSAAAKTYTGFTAQSITQQTVAADSSTVVEIKYNRNNITYTFNANGGNWNGNTANKTVSGLYGATVSRPADPTKTGYTFSAWSSTVPSTFGATDTTFTASWNVNSYKVKFNANGGTGTMSDQSVAYGSSASLTANAFAKTGHTFAGWATSTTGAAAYANGASYTMNSTSDVTLYAVWTANTYKVTFNKNGGSGTMADQTFTYGTAQALTASAFTRNNYTFSGWATSASGAVAYNDGQSVSNLATTNGATVTLYAVWTINTYKVKFDKNGGTGTMADQSIAYGASAALTANAFTKTGYNFAGWATSAGGSVAYINGASYIMNSTSDVTLYAVWYFGTKSPAEAKAVGDIVFSDGSATPYTSGLTLTDAQKNAAVAMIFYKGTECSNDGSTRTLGVGLKRSASTMQWCLNTANGYATNITTIQCPPSGSAGAYTFAGDKDGSDNLSQIAAFLAGNNDTGTAGNYPAFDYAKNYGSTNGCTGAYANGWYLPGIAELYQIYNLRTNINAAVALCGLSDTFSSTYFWSSTQHASSIKLTAHRLSFSDGCCYNTTKTGNGLVCAVRAF